jgi:hypothetical protein
LTRYFRCDILFINDLNSVDATICRLQEGPTLGAQSSATASHLFL